VQGVLNSLILGDKVNKTPAPEEYTEEYFLTNCGGYKEYLEGELSQRHRKALEYLQVRPGEAILDIGCGRGELLRACNERGGNSVGIDYSSAAIRISRHGQDNIALIQASATALPFREETFDKVIMLDIVEHLSLDDLFIALRDVKRVLKNQGQVLIHTPNQWGDFLSAFYYKTLSIFRIPFRKQTVNLEPCSYDTLHVSVLNPISLKRILSSLGFRSEVWFAGHPLQQVPLVWYLVDRLLPFLTTIWCKAYKV
jgi:ubiquinone/menaquinone biosynthesis C-methylase UbiE